MWEYKTATINTIEGLLDSKLNEFGKDNWEIFSIEKSPSLNLKYTISMKRKIVEKIEVEKQLLIE